MYLPTSPSNLTCFIPNRPSSQLPSKFKKILYFFRFFTFSSHYKILHYYFCYPSQDLTTPPNSWTRFLSSQLRNLLSLSLSLPPTPSPKIPIHSYLLLMSSITFSPNLIAIVSLSHSLTPTSFVPYSLPSNFSSHPS